MLKEGKPETIDWIFSGGMFVVGLIFIVWGMLLLIGKQQMGWLGITPFWSNWFA